MFKIEISNHPLFSDITRKVSMIELAFNEGNKAIEMKIMVNHFKDGVAFPDLDKVISLDISNKEHFPTGNPEMPYVGDYDYFVMSAEAGQQFSVMVTQGVQAVDAKGTINSRMNYKAQKPAITVIPTVVDSDYGMNNGSISLEISGGFEPYTVEWSTGDTTPSIDELMPGEYSYTVSDASTYTDDVTGTVTITELPEETE